MIRNFVSKLLLLSCAMFGVLELNAQSVLIPTTAISTIPVATMDNISEGRKEFVILQTITASASVNSDNKRGSRTIWEADNEFKLIYDIKKEGGRRYLEYEDCMRAPPGLPRQHRRIQLRGQLPPGGGNRQTTGAVPPYQSCKGIWRRCADYADDNHHGYVVQKRTHLSLGSVRENCKNQKRLML